MELTEFCMFHCYIICNVVCFHNKMLRYCFMIDYSSNHYKFMVPERSNQMNQLVIVKKCTCIQNVSTRIISKIILILRKWFSWAKIVSKICKYLKLLMTYIINAIHKHSYTLFTFILAPKKSSQSDMFH